jgi:hypothetical protein
MPTNEHSGLAVILETCAGRRRDEPGVMHLTSWRAICFALICACTQQTASAEQPPTVSSEPSSRTLEAKPADPGLAPNGVAEEQEKEEEDPAELLRGYGIVDMRFNNCVTRENDHTVLGTGCPGGFLIYGPYVSVPPDSEIDVSFEIKPSRDVSIYADIVSQMGAQTLAGLNRQRLDAGELKKLGYRVHVFNADVNVESRIGIDAEPGTSFEITNLTMTVR